MDSIGKVVTALTHPKEALWELHRLYSMAVRRRSDSVMNRDWDTLIILDACRYDLFKEVHDLPGNLSSVQSVASATAEFIQRTFSGCEFYDTVCVTSTPKYVEQDVNDVFHDVIHVWEDEWDEEERTVLPEVMAKYVEQAHREYPNKRIIAHFIPPHVPFIGETGKHIPHEVVFGGDIIEQDTEQQNLWSALGEGKLDEEIVWQAYRENLELALPHVKRLMEGIDGKTVITSDHGNGVGEWGVYGHPPRRHINPLTEVPWLEYENGSRRTITRDSPRTRSGGYDDEGVEQRLKDLGYK